MDAVLNIDCMPLPTRRLFQFKYDRGTNTLTVVDVHDPTSFCVYRYGARRITRPRLVVDHIRR
jgi:hypothetical protein